MSAHIGSSKSVSRAAVDWGEVAIAQALSPSIRVGPHEVRPSLLEALRMGFCDEEGACTLDETQCLLHLRYGAEKLNEQNRFIHLGWRCKER